MTYGQCKKKVLEHIFSQSIAGEEISLTYNNQADYVRKIPGLINDCEMYIATSGKRIPAMVKLEDLEYEELGSNKIYSLPDDFFDMNSGLIKANGEYDRAATDRIKDYRWYGDRKIIVPNRVGSDLLLSYWRYPVELGDSVSDRTQLDNTPDVHECIPYFVAAHLVRYDSAFDYSSLYNEFETRFQRLQTPVYTEESVTENMYDGFNYSMY